MKPNVSVAFRKIQIITPNKNDFMQGPGTPGSA